MASLEQNRHTGITGCILARNEEHRIEDALKSLAGWTDQIIVIDNESEDATVEVARRYADLVLTAPRAANFDAARNLAIEHATGDWIFYLDADERVPARLGPILAQMVQEQGDTFEALLVPFRHFFCGKWIEHSGWWPGYTRPQLLKKGTFRYNARLHSGVEVNGRTVVFPADDPELAILHYSYDDLRHYIGKMNNYTDGEAESLDTEGGTHAWQAMLAHFTHDWQTYYERGRADLDGMHGFVLSFMSAFYRFASRAKLWDRRRKRGEASPAEPVPSSLQEMLAFMAHVAKEGAQPWLAPPASVPPSERVPILWCAPLLDPSGYADEARNFVLALLEAGVPLSVFPVIWNEEDAGLDPADRARIMERAVRADTPADVYISQTTPPLNRPSPNALVNVCRTMFETDRLQPGWEQVLNRMDRVWVPSEFNRETFVRSGVAPEKIVVIPGGMDPAPFAQAVEPWPVPGAEPFKFLSVFDWTWHKGWDVLLHAFAEEFGANPDVGLILKVWSSNGYTHDDIVAQAEALLRERTGKGLADFPNIHIWRERIPVKGMPRLYHAVDAFVLPTRGEGWGRPLMEAMAAGLPTIATGWSGLTAFHNARVGYPVRYCLVPVSAAGAQEIPIYSGHYWAEPDRDDLRGQMRAIVARPETARRKGQAAQKAIAKHYSRPAIAAILQEELAFCSALARKRKGLLQHREPLGIVGNGADPACDTLLIQAAQGEHTSLLEMTRAHHAAYAHAHGMEYRCRFGPQQTGRHPHWDKIVLVREALAEGTYQHIFWLDADTLIVDPKQDLREAVPAGAWLGMVRHPGENGDPPHINAGALYITACAEARAFFDAVWQTWPVNNAWEDQAAINRVLDDDSRYKDGVVTLDDAWNSTLKINESPSPVVLAWHGYGTTQERLASMRKVARERNVTLASEVAPGTAKERLTELLRPAANPIAVDAPLPVDLASAFGRPIRVRWEGDQTIRSSLALVNRELCLQLLGADDTQLEWSQKRTPWHTLTDADDTRFPALFGHRECLHAPPDVTVRHQFPTNWDRPETGKLVILQPWEFGHLPRAWVEGAIHRADELWVYSRFVRDVCVASGVPAEKVQIVPLGVRPELFTPDGPHYPVPTKKSLRFLFVGGTIERKGADRLLEAYLRAFRKEDDVCLVVKDMGTRSFYQGQTFSESFRRAEADAGGPEVVYLDRDLTDPELAALYRACTCVCLPYRGEGFGLSPLEGMSCGLPAIVTAGGPTDDYLDETMGLRVPFRRRYQGHSYAGSFECVGDPWNLEPDLDALIDAMRWVQAHPDETRRRGEAARAHVLQGWTWEQAAGKVRARLHALTTSPPQASEPARSWAERTPKRSRAKTVQADTPEISLCMIARDEEPRIAECLKGIAPYVDEMVVVDTGSCDRTREIARDAGARVFEMAWPDNFAAARNQSVDLARGKWIFWMDADDVITPDSGRQLRELARRHPQCDAAYQVAVRLPPRPGEFSPSVVDHVKLFPNRPDVRFEHRIHEQILPALRLAGIPVHLSDAYVTHQNYDRSEEGQAKKRARDYRLLELDLRERPNHPFVLFNLGMTHLYGNQEYEVAAHYLQRSLAASDIKDSIVRKAYAMLTTARTCQQEWEQAIAANEKGREHYPDDAELLFLAGRLYQQVGRFADARRALERLVEGTDDPHFRSVDAGLRTYRGRHELALLFQRMGDPTHCREELEEILHGQPDYMPARVDLAETWLALGQEGEARAVVRALSPDKGLEERVRSLRNTLGMSAGM